MRPLGASPANTIAPDSLKCILCIYGCDREPYNTLRRALLSAPWMTTLVQDHRVTAYVVFADPNLSAPRLVGNRLVLPCAEQYDALARKTLSMVQYFCANHEFDYLIKLDDSFAVDPNGSPPKDPSIFEYCHGDYAGCSCRITFPPTTKRWLREKHLHVCDDSFPWWMPYFSGALYALSRRAALAVSCHGERYVTRFLRECAGIEDVMIAAILHRHFFSPTQRCRLYLTALQSEARLLARRIKARTRACSHPPSP